MNKPTMTVIGFGRMGKKFTDLFSREFDVRVASTRDVREEILRVGGTRAEDRSRSIAESDYVFLAVPVTALSALVEELNARDLRDVVVIDCCSARMRAEQELARLNYRHFGLHDLRRGEYCITGDIDERMRDFFARRNVPLRQVSPEEHDRLNAIIGLGHFIGLVLGEMLGEEEKEVLAGVRSGSWLVGLMKHLEGNSYTTWRETQLDNPLTAEQRARLIAAYREYDGALRSGAFPFKPTSEPAAAPRGSEPGA